MAKPTNSIEPDRSEHNTSAQDFVFLGEVLALDFVNTEVVVRTRPRDLLATPADLVAWWRAALDHHPITVAGADTIAQAGPDALTNAKVLRQSLRGIFTAVAHAQAIEAADLAILNQALQLGHASVTTATNGHLAPIYRTDHNHDAPLRFAIALSAFHLLTEGDLSRLHQCKSERCVLLFYDTTKSATRRWCSTDCMNRARSVAHYRQSRA